MNFGAAAPSGRAFFSPIRLDSQSIFRKNPSTFLLVTLVPWRLSGGGECLGPIDAVLDCLMWFTMMMMMMKAVVVVVAVTGSDGLKFDAAVLMVRWSWFARARSRPRSIEHFIRAKCGRCYISARSFLPTRGWSELLS